MVPGTVKTRRGNLKDLSRGFFHRICEANQSDLTSQAISWGTVILPASHPRDKYIQLSLVQFGTLHAPHEYISV